MHAKICHSAQLVFLGRTQRARHCLQRTLSWVREEQVGFQRHCQVLKQSHLAAAAEGVRAVVSLQQECDLATWGVNHADLQWRAGELGVSLQRCPVRPWQNEPSLSPFSQSPCLLAKLVTCHKGGFTQ